LAASATTPAAPVPPLAALPSHVQADFRSNEAARIHEHVAGADDFEVAEATYRAAVARWPTARITLRQAARVVHDTGQRQ
jgi:hypothetical protein